MAYHVSHSDYSGGGWKLVKSLALRNGILLLEISHPWEGVWARVFEQRIEISVTMLVARHPRVSNSFKINRLIFHRLFFPSKETDLFHFVFRRIKVVKSILPSNFLLYIFHFRSSLFIWLVRYFREQGNDMNRCSYNIFQRFRGWKWNEIAYDDSDFIPKPSSFSFQRLSIHSQDDWIKICKFSHRIHYSISVWTFATRIPSIPLNTYEKQRTPINRVGNNGAMLDKWLGNGSGGNLPPDCHYTLRRRCCAVNHVDTS